MHTLDGNKQVKQNNYSAYENNVIETDGKSRKVC